MATGRLKYYHKTEFTERKPKKTYPLGCDVDKEDIFDYPYLVDDNTVECFKRHGRIMFIIRGPNSTMKATLSEMIINKYPGSQHCCADHYFSKTFSAPERTKDTMAKSHEYCEKLVEQACMKSTSPIIVQNTHIRKWEVQKYIDMAAEYNYTVVMAVTLYKFDVTAEGLERTSTDGLNVQYFRNRLRQWEDIAPLLTGLFLCPDDASFIINSVKSALISLLSDGCFCRTFDIYDTDDICNYFTPRRTLYCKLGYSHSKAPMKKYYLSDLVQDSYGKSYSIHIKGYIVTLSSIMGIVQITDEIKPLIFDDEDPNDDITEAFSTLDTSNIISEYKHTTSFDDNCDSSNKFVILEDCSDKTINFQNCKLIHLAQRRDENFSITNVEKMIVKLLSLDDDMQYTALEEGINACRLPDSVWIIKLSETLRLQTIFTGLYV